MKKRSKYNVRTDDLGKLERTADGILFDSKAECKRYKELKIMERARIISNLELQPSYVIKWPCSTFFEGPDKKICTVNLDFRYKDGEGITHIEDVKGCDTAVSKLKRKLVEIAYEIEVKLIKKKR